MCDAIRAVQEVMGLSAIHVTESSRKMVFGVLSVENKCQTDLKVILYIESNGEVRIACESIGLKMWSRMY